MKHVTKQRGRPGWLALGLAIFAFGCDADGGNEAKIPPGDARSVATPEGPSRAASAAAGDPVVSAPAMVPASEAPGETLGGFSLAGLRIAREQIREGGPKRDQIRGVDAPRFVSPDEARVFVAPETPVLGVVRGDLAHEYPVHVIERHQVVNDVFGDDAVAVFYDPLAGVPMAVRRRADDRTLTFGVSGLVANGTALYFDRETESLWSPLEGGAVAGPLAGRRFETLRVHQEPHELFLRRAPQALVLERPDRAIDYRVSPYETYWTDEQLHFPVAARDDRFHPKEVVLGVVAGGRARAYLGSALTAAGGRVADEIDGRKIRIAYDTEASLMQWDAPEGVEAVEAYWFAWTAFHPDTEVWQANAAGNPDR